MATDRHHDRSAAIARWIDCRRRKAAGDGASLYFLEVDMQSAEPLMFDWDADTRVERMMWVQQVFRLLQVRLGQRAWGLAHAPLNPQAVAGLRIVSDFMRAASVTHLGDDLAAMESAYDRFAAGLLRQDCGTIDTKYRNIIACDADSSAIFFFAELGYALTEIDEELAAYWRPCLNCMVRAQAIYLARWAKDDPQCFSKYQGPIPPLDHVPESITRLYQWIGDDQSKLDTAYRCNLARVASSRSCFG